MNVDIDFDMGINNVADQLAEKWAEQLKKDIKESLIAKIFSSPKLIMELLDSTGEKQWYLDRLNESYGELVNSGYIKPTLTAFGQDRKEFATDGRVISEASWDVRIYADVPGMECSIGLNVFGSED